MFYFSVLCVVAWLVCTLIVFVNITKKSTALGCLTILFLPIAPFILVWTKYTGNKKLMIPLLYLTAILGFSSIAFTLNQAEKDLEPFFKSAYQELSLRCRLDSVGTKSGLREYELECAYDNFDKIKFKDIDELLKIHKELIADKAVLYYPDTLKENSDSSIVIGIRNKGGFTTCFRLRPNGKVSDSWYSGADDLCE